MSDVGQEPEVANDIVVPARPVATSRKDRVLPILVAASLVLHATMFLPSLLRSQETEPPKAKEIPVEVVQLPPPPKPQPKQAAAKPPAPKQPAPKPPVEKAQQKPPPKVAEQKPKPEPKSEPKPEPKPAAKPATKSVAERMKDLLGPMPAVAMPASAADGSDAVSYSQLVLSKLAKAKKEGRYAGIPAAASVSFTLGDSGDVAHVEIVRPSGDPSLDAEAIAMVKRGAPYPAPPPGGRRDYTITLRFQALI